jgi:hypothetical protein
VETSPIPLCYLPTAPGLRLPFRHPARTEWVNHSIAKDAARFDPLARREVDPNSAFNCVLPIAIATKLGVATAEAEHMPIYLRTVFRVLSSWVHHQVSRLLLSQLTLARVRSNRARLSSGYRRPEGEAS